MKFVEICERNRDVVGSGVWIDDLETVGNGGRRLLAAKQRGLT